MKKYHLTKQGFFIFAIILVSAIGCTAKHGANRSSAKTSEGAPKWEDCRSDLEKYCSEVKPGGGRLIDCLSKESKNLNSKCGNLIEQKVASRK